jgi:hypothetical protein
MSAGYTLTWKPEVVLKQTRADLAANAELAGAFVEAQARVNLNRIPEPEWGGKYRRGIVSGLLSHEVEIKKNEVVINVGVKPLAGNRKIGFYIEMGSSKFGPHPFLRPAVFENAQKITALLSGK